MKKKIGLIDLYIDEWHSNNLVKMMMQAKRRDEFELAYAWEEAPFPGRRNLAEWCSCNNLTAAASIEEVVEKSDAICVLAPANPEVHLRLAESALHSGKPVYVDKPFADSLHAAQTMFELAEKYSTPLMTSSALRFCDELLCGEIQAMKPLIFNTTGGGRSFAEYAIHQLEMIVSAMGTEVVDMALTGDMDKLALVLKFSGARLATAVYAKQLPFSMSTASEDGMKIYPDVSNMWENFTDALLDFYTTGVSCVPKEQTLCIAELLERAVALQRNSTL